MYVYIRVCKSTCLNYVYCKHKRALKFLLLRGKSLFASTDGTMTISISESIVKYEYYAFSHFELGLHYDL